MRKGGAPGQLPVAPAGGLIEEPTKLKVLLALEPRVVMAAMHTTTIRASITAYSTAVGPSSAFRNDTRFLAIDFMRNPQVRASSDGEQWGSVEARPVGRTWVTAR